MKDYSQRSIVSKGVPSTIIPKQQLSPTHSKPRSISTSIDTTNNEVTRVWVRQSAIDSVMTKQSKFYKPSQSTDEQQTTHPTSTSTSTPTTSNSSTTKLRQTFQSTSISSSSSEKMIKPLNTSNNIRSTPPPSNVSYNKNRTNNVTTGSVTKQSPSRNIIKSFVPTTTPQQLSYHSTCGSSSTSTADVTQDGSSDSSGGGSIIHASIFTGRVMQWGWKEGILFHHPTSSHNQEPHTLSIQLSTSSATVDGDTTTTSSTSNIIMIELPHTALEAGDVVLANERIDPISGTSIAAPHDLISLTHLHEPAVCVALQQRYTSDIIYTNTGPVLLAINPFCVIPGLYGESIQRKYVDAAEKMNIQSLPPHVYSIADAAFRSMMRSIEDISDKVDSQSYKLNKDLHASFENNGIMKPDGVNGTTTGRHCINQSILISGESGSGKTVTTKFVMKYLAALSQRSVQIQETTKERAYLKVKDERNNNKSVISSSNNTTTSWRKSGTVNGSTNISNDTAIELTGNTIEAQVLQSNPILESFGNARTVRNDNSSRFGKFIEIQFTATGKLVGAILQTYLLEKVRLNYQNYGERNYHIFYELLSGSMSHRQLSQFFLAPTANPDDFKLTNSSGTNTRRDGVSDRETCTGLLSAFETMKFSKTDVHDVFAIIAAILHASNLSFIDLKNDTCCLDETNVHFYPVCTLLGLTVTDLNQAICHCQLTAGEVNVTRSLSSAQAVIGLESLLKETYGALFQYLVKRINSQMAMVDESVTAAATIGVLDIFGFESFAVNSFEQLCINYCNEALQQQFNAFVLQNEQAEYEREGIQWSFIEFPENQDVLDLMEKRGSSVLSILDDQCRAPGPSDKAFCLAVYSQCSNKPRFSATRKQQAMLQFCIHHYAGPVEYTVAGFTAKNKDEPPKETILLLRNSSMPLVRDLAGLMEDALEPTISGEVDSSGEFKAANVSKRLHRADSSMARPTVGGQFRTQLRTLRHKIDRTAPHYIRCLKPNDLLVADHFDIAIVAEQLKCGGILEAVRVARAGFTQHYSHADFCRRYRALAWKEMSTSAASYNHSNMNAQAPPKWNVPSSSPKAKSIRHSFPVSNFVPKSSTSTSIKQQPIKHVPELSPADAKAMCKDLLKFLYRKIERYGGITVENVGAVASSSTETFDTPSPVAKAKSYSYKSPSYAVPSWTAKAAQSPSPKNTDTIDVKRDVGSFATPSKNAIPATTNGWKPRGSSSLITGADLARVGIQMGKTKVFLRHKAFEVLERIRGSEQCMAATTLNSIFRRYLARIAYLPYRDAMRQARERQRHMNYASTGNNSYNMEYDDFKEMKEQEYDDDEYPGTVRDGNITMRKNFQSARSSFYNNGGQYTVLSSDKWTELQIKEAIHNPVPRHEWGKQAPLDAEKFKWVIREGLWVKNYA
jgi:myosin V